MTTDSYIRDIARQFKIDGALQNVAPHGSGHINDTYLLTYQHYHTDIPYILQRINHFVFSNPPAVMENIRRVTEHIRRKLKISNTRNISRKVMTVIPTRKGHDYYQDPEGNYWRVFLFIQGAQSFDRLKSTDQAYEAAYMYGNFLRYLEDFPAETLHETIPGFHDGPGRVAAFRHALKENPHNRAEEAKKEIDFAITHAPLTERLPELIKQKKIPIRVTHNDTKLNNVMLDEKTGKGLCVVDLDTVMPGVSLYDFGDLARSMLSASEEDESDVTKISVQLPRFKAIVTGYLAATGSLLTDSEKEHLVFSTKLMSFIIGTRFLTDFLLGDVYFKTHRPGHNLERCRAQFRLVQSIIENEKEMEACF